MCPRRGVGVGSSQETSEFRVVLRIMVANGFKVADYGRNKLRPYGASAFSTSENTDRDR